MLTWDTPEGKRTTAGPTAPKVCLPHSRASRASYTCKAWRTPVISNTIPHHKLSSSTQPPTPNHPPLETLSNPCTRNGCTGASRAITKPCMYFETLSDLSYTHTRRRWTRTCSHRCTRKHHCTRPPSQTKHLRHLPLKRSRTTRSTISSRRRRERRRGSRWWWRRKVYSSLTQ